MEPQHGPGRWVGRTVRMRAVAWLCLEWAYGPCRIPSPILNDPGAHTGLRLTRRRANPLLAFVHALPLMDRLVPLEQAPQWGVLASYCAQTRPCRSRPVAIGPATRSS
jgi:hypothetical protein